MSTTVIDTNTMDLDTPAIASTDSNMTESVCPSAPRKRARSPSEAMEIEAYDAVVRQLVSELTVQLDAMPPVEGLMMPSGLQRQQAMDPDAQRIHSPIVMDSPAALYISPGERQVSAELELADRATSPLKRRETDIEGDLPAASSAAAAASSAAASVELNTAELPESESESESDGEETEEVSDDEDADDEGCDEDEDEGCHACAAATETIEHVEDTNTNGIYLTFHHQPKTGELALRFEAPVWMLGVWLAVVTAYMWLMVYMIKKA
jgi:hypothetical protein